MPAFVRSRAAAQGARERRRDALCQGDRFCRAAVTSVLPLRSRRWRGALVSNKSVVEFRILESERRPVSAVADQVEVRDVRHVKVSYDLSRRLELLFDPDYALDDRIVMEQFLS